MSQWRPNHPAPGIAYVGPKVCAECHDDVYSRQTVTVMNRALQSAEDSPVLKSHPSLNFRLGPYTYRISRVGQRSVYSVTDGKDTLSEPVLWSFGQGRAGQTYVFEHKGNYYESHVSFFNDSQSLDNTIGHPRTIPESLEEAAGRPIGSAEIRSCIGCHSTGAVSGKELHIEKMIPGVSCEACHGPGGKHVSAMKEGSLKESYILNPGRLSADRLSQEFCGACHRSVDDVMLLPNPGQISNVRMQPYRLFNSSCYSDDRRIACTACHASTPVPPGQARHSDKNSRDSSKKMAPSCPAGTRQCVGCHMPKVELPGAHFKFTDHWIRIVRAGDPYPV